MGSLVIVHEGQDAWSWGFPGRFARGLAGRAAIEASGAVWTASGPEVVARFTEGQAGDGGDGQGRHRESDQHAARRWKPRRIEKRHRGLASWRTVKALGEFGHPGGHSSSGSLGRLTRPRPRRLQERRPAGRGGRRRWGGPPPTTTARRAAVGASRRSGVRPGGCALARWASRSGSAGCCSRRRPGRRACPPTQAGARPQSRGRGSGARRRAPPRLSEDLVLDLADAAGGPEVREVGCSGALEGRGWPCARASSSTRRSEVDRPSSCCPLNGRVVPEGPAEPGAPTGTRRDAPRCREPRKEFSSDTVSWSKPSPSKSARMTRWGGAAPTAPGGRPRPCSPPGAAGAARTLWP